MRKLGDEFRSFLKEYKVIGIAVGFVMGFAITAFIKSFVNDILMPLIGLVVNGNWQESKYILWGAEISWGPFLAALLNLVIIALVVFFFVKFFIKSDYSVRYKKKKEAKKRKKK